MKTRSQQLQQLARKNMDEWAKVSSDPGLFHALAISQLPIKMKTSTTERSPLGSGTCSPFFVFDVESIGLHGQAFAVAGGVYDRDGNTLHEFAFHCHPDNADGELSDRDWIMANVSQSTASIGKIEPRGVRNAFWREWLAAKEQWPGITMAVECGWPVEARFLNACIDDDRGERNWSGPYPMHEIASIMLAAGMDPMATYERLPHELPAHEPLADARQSARLLATALKSLVNVSI